MSTSQIVLVVAGAGAVALLLVISAIRIVREYQRVVVFRLGGCAARADPGWC